MAISGSPAVYGTAQPYRGHVMAPYPEAPQMTSPYSVDPAWNPYASIGQPYNAHQGFNSGYATHNHSQNAYKSKDGPLGKGKEKSDQAAKDNNSTGNISRGATDIAKGKSTSVGALAVPLKLGHRRESTSRVVIANGSYTTNTTTAEAGAAVGKKDRSSVVIAYGNYTVLKDKLSTN
ncbi:hypothetical protein B0H65DRAFT_592916 [Neurospora tetraspora]|uniref:Uncharacterized protein n=1 Tax=Neurospora tetraspora TaxID=94610 RepID=A0AAE0J1V1_9PEZI|nr:hypothetical protein B0H65DRAFT_592916 [Neurospora tetraspora]